VVGTTSQLLRRKKNRCQIIDWGQKAREAREIKSLKKKQRVMSNRPSQPLWSKKKKKKKRWGQTKKGRPYKRTPTPGRLVEEAVREDRLKNITKGATHSKQEGKPTKRYSTCRLKEATRTHPKGEARLRTRKKAAKIIETSPSTKKKNERKKQHKRRGGG